MKHFLRLRDVEVNNKVVLVRTDLNVPMQGSEITDHARITRLLPTINYLTQQNARVVLISHFGSRTILPFDSNAFEAYTDRWSISNCSYFSLIFK